MRTRLNPHSGRKPKTRESARLGRVWRSSQPWQLDRDGFTLLEVIVACSIFFLVAFSVLEMVTRGLAAARVLQQRQPDAGMLASVQSETNILIEGSESGDFEELYPDLYPGYSWTKEDEEYASNGLHIITYTVVGTHRGRGVSETRMPILLFRPESPPGSASIGFGSP